MSDSFDMVSVVSQSLLRRFGLDAGKRLPEVASQIGLDIVYRCADSYEGALLRIKGVPRGCVVINSAIRENSRRRFTLAHEIGHFLLPDQQELSSPCAKDAIESWDEQLVNPELEANRFAAELLIPSTSLAPFLRVEPSFESVRQIAEQCETSLTASTFQLITLTSFRAAVVWSHRNRVRWYKSSGEFVRWIRKGELSEATYAFDWFKKKTAVNGFQAVPASAWLFEKGLKEDAKVWEHSVGLPNYDAVLTLLVIREPIEEWDEASPNEPELDPGEFTLKRKYWPRKR
jgi:hypothetical protein